MRSAEGKKCVRSYRVPDLQPSSTTTITLTLGIPENQREGILFYLSSSTNVRKYIINIYPTFIRNQYIPWFTRTFLKIFQDDYVAIEMFDRKIRFIWNVGGGTGVVTHPEVLLGGSVADGTKWYRIEAERWLNDIYLFINYKFWILLNLLEKYWIKISG